jgi:hypothetical protein
MVRPIRVRSTYTGDRSRLSRLELAIEKDPRLTAEERRAVGDSIRAVIKRLMQIDASRDLAGSSGRKQAGAASR